MHMFRNSMDHGFETPEERKRLNKPEQGKIRIDCERHADYIELRIGDDGRGLALHKLYDKGMAGGIFLPEERPTRDAIADLIFRAGLSTAAQLTQISGRGVGMDVVRAFLKAQGATIHIELAEQSASELGFTPFQFIVHVPATAYSY
jgi:chemotaxis protein histidine kinase CheA